MSRKPSETENDTIVSMDSLPGIRKLHHDKADLYPQKPKSKPSIRHRNFSDPDQTISTISKTVPESVSDSWFHHGIQKKMQRNMRMGKLPMDSILDLHGYRQHEAVKELSAFLTYALKTQAKFLLIIHGKGFRSQQESKLRPLVQYWLSEQQAVIAYTPAQPKDGGNGATYVYLKSPGK